MVVAVVFITACTTPYQIQQTQTTNYRIHGDSLQLYDSSIQALITPYKTSLDVQMKQVVGSTRYKLTKERPEGTLNNLMADAALVTTRYKFREVADVAVFNYGGIRIPFIEAGPITLGKVYELMPFDNKLVLLEVSGSVLLELLNLTASQGGWAVSGLRMKIKNGKAEQVFIRDNPLDTQMQYRLVTSDFVANGGDRATMLKQATQRTELNYLLRDAILELIRKDSPLELKTENRVVHEAQ